MENLLTPLFILMLALFCFLSGVLFAYLLRMKRDAKYHKKFPMRNLPAPRKPEDLDKRYLNKTSAGSRVKTQVEADNYSGSFFLNNMDPGNMSYTEIMAKINMAYDDAKKD